MLAVLPSAQADPPALLSLVAALEARDPYTCGHSQRVAYLATLIGRLLELPTFVLDQLRMTAQLHDIGKIGVPDRILHKEGRLTKNERTLINQHPVIGVQIVARTLPAFVPGILYHHERWDGGGYPNGLAGEAIPLDGRIIAVADAFDAMTSDRSYRAAKSAEEAKAILMAGRDVQWDARLVDLFCGFGGNIDAT